MSDRDIKSHLEKIYNVDVSPDLISRVTNAVLDEVKEWQNRPLDKSYAIIYLDALRVKGRIEGKSCLKSVYTALAINFEGQKEVLGLWIAETEGAKCGLKSDGWACLRNLKTADLAIYSLPVWTVLAVFLKLYGLFIRIPAFSCA
jgi:transposase-like protein